jgi:radical SAM-linked protein
LLARGDRRLADTIDRAYENGARFDGWSDYLRLDAWNAAIEATGIDTELELGPRKPSEILPWDIIDAGVRKGFLRAEWRRAQRELETSDCKWGHCYRCGVPGNGEDVRLAQPTLPTVDIPRGEIAALPSPAYRDREIPRMPPRPAPQSQPPLYRRYRITFGKTGDARFLSHRQTMDALERALRAARSPVRYSEGFNPHIRLSMGPALPLGFEGLNELFDVDCTAPVTAKNLEVANRLLPDGISLADATALIPGAGSIGKLAERARYRVEARTDRSWPARPPRLPDDLGDGLRSWRLCDDGAVLVELNLRAQDGPTPNIRTVLQAASVPEEDVVLLRVVREAVVLRPRSISQQAATETSSCAG